VTVVNFTPGSALIGGAIIGLAAAGLWGLLGRLAGVSTILGGTLTPRWSEISWRLAFLSGLLASGLLAVWFFPAKLGFDLRAGYVQVIVAGLLVGFGTQLGSGCTSGHGVCGLSRLSVRSMVATLVFMAAGVATVHLWSRA